MTEDAESSYTEGQEPQSPDEAAREKVGYNSVTFVEEDLADSAGGDDVDYNSLCETGDTFVVAIEKFTVSYMLEYRTSTGPERETSAQGRSTKSRG